MNFQSAGTFRIVGERRGIEDRDPAHADALGTRGEPNCMHRGHRRIFDHFRHGAAAEAVALRRRPIGKDGEMRRRFFQSGELEPRIGVGACRSPGRRAPARCKWRSCPGWRRAARRLRRSQSAMAGSIPPKAQGRRARSGSPGRRSARRRAGSAAHRGARPEAHASARGRHDRIRPVAAPMPRYRRVCCAGLSAGSSIEAYLLSRNSAIAICRRCQSGSAAGKPKRSQVAWSGKARVKMPARPR